MTGVALLWGCFFCWHSYLHSQNTLQPQSSTSTAAAAGAEQISISATGIHIPSHVRLSPSEHAVLAQFQERLRKVWWAYCAQEKSSAFTFKFWWLYVECQNNTYCSYTHCIVPLCMSSTSLDAFYRIAYKVLSLCCLEEWTFRATLITNLRLTLQKQPWQSSNLKYWDVLWH